MSPRPATLALPLAAHRRRESLARWLATGTIHVDPPRHRRPSPRLFLLTGRADALAVEELGLAAVARATVRLELADTAPYPVLRRAAVRAR